MALIHVLNMALVHELTFIFSTHYGFNTCANLYIFTQYGFNTSAMARVRDNI